MGVEQSAVEFHSAQVEAAPELSKIVFAFFDGHPTPRCVGLFVCSVTTARTLVDRAGSVLDSLRPSE